MAKLNVKHFRYINACKKIMHTVVPGSVLHSVVFRLIRSWVFQGALYMEYSEILFRIFVESLLVVAIYHFLFSELSFTSITASFILAHTIMWLFNGHFWALSLGDGKRMAQNNPDNILKYFSDLDHRLQHDSTIDGCVIFGSLARGEFTENSDIDILLCKRSGLSNSLIAYLVGMRERLIAFLHRIPIELYFYNIDIFERLDEGESPMLIKDDSGAIQRVVDNTINFKEYPLSDQQFFKNHQY